MLIGADTSCKMILHVGGAYGGKPEAMDRFVEVANGLPEAVRRRLVIENDDVTYTIAEVLDVSRARDYRSSSTGCTTRSTRARTPAPNREADRGLLRHMAPRGRAAQGPLQQPGPRGPIGSVTRIGSIPTSSLAFLEQTPDREFDCMLESKKKDLALFRLREEMERMAVKN